MNSMKVNYFAPTKVVLRAVITLKECARQSCITHWTFSFMPAWEMCILKLESRITPFVTEYDSYNFNELPPQSQPVIIDKRFFVHLVCVQGREKENRRRRLIPVVRLVEPLIRARVNFNWNSKFSCFVCTFPERGEDGRMNKIWVFEGNKAWRLNYDAKRWSISWLKVRDVF